MVDIPKIYYTNNFTLDTHPELLLIAYFQEISLKEIQFSVFHCLFYD